MTLQYPITVDSNSMFSVREFWFGAISTENDELCSSKADINNYLANDAYSNTTVITPDFRGVGLPSSSHAKFVTLLS